MKDNPNIFVLYSPGLGGNHVANMLSTSTGYKPRATVNDYINHQDADAHVNSLINDEQIKLKNTVYTYHFATFLWNYSKIKDLYQNRKILIIESPTHTDTLAYLRYTQKYKISKNSYFYQEQKLLYSIDTIQKLTNETDFHVISADLFFCDSIDKFIEFTENSMGLNLNTEMCKKIHKIWIEKIKNLNPI